jgi:pyruvate kinase
MLVWGVYPLLAPRVDNTDQMIADAVAAAQRAGYLREGDLVVITGGAAGYSAGTTNLLKVQKVA